MSATRRDSALQRSERSRQGKSRGDWKRYEGLPSRNSRQAVPGKRYEGLSFSPAKPQEQEWITERLRNIVGEDAEKMLEGKTIILGKRGGESEIFLVSPELLPWFERIKKRTDPQAIGLFLGSLKKDVRLGIESSWKISRLAKVNEKAEQLALYGRDVFLDSVIEEKGGIKEGDLCVIANAKGEPLALGRMSRKLNIICNLLDRGEYIRGGLYK